MEATNMAGFQAQWAIDEFAGIDLNDNRLNTRAITIATQLGTIGESSPQKKKKKRDSLPIEQKESYRWLQMTRRGMQIARENPGTEYVGVSDSESDIGELLSESVLRPNNSVDGCIHVAGGTFGRLHSQTRSRSTRSSRDLAWNPTSRYPRNRLQGFRS